MKILFAIARIICYREIHLLQLNSIPSLLHFHQNSRIIIVAILPAAKVETMQFPVCPGDRILLCSDGVHKSMESEDLEARMMEEKSLEEILHGFDLSCWKYGDDNYTSDTPPPGLAAADSTCCRPHGQWSQCPPRHLPSPSSFPSPPVLPLSPSAR